ncbi:MAG: alanine racemase [Gammaproteobacteria bacterium]
MTRTTRALIDLHALQHNLGRVRELAPASRVMAIVKADAYGHGSVRVAYGLASVDSFGVARLNEAITLREAGITQPIVLLEGFLDAAELPLICQHRLSVVVHHAAQIDMLERAVLSAPVPVWIKVDSGMHRLGFTPAEVRNAWERLKCCPQVAKPLRLMTHLASADNRADDLTSKQLTCFNSTVAGLDAEHSIANSAAILGWPQTHADWVRPGLMLYGVSPFPGRTAAQDGLRPVMTLSTKLIAKHALSKGDSVGYGASWTCPHDMPIGIAAIGYGDGYPRHAVSGTPVLLNGRRVSLIGRVSMDMICLDLSTQPEAGVGDAVILWGEGLPVEEVAQHASTIPYELLCAVARRVTVDVASTLDDATAPSGAPLSIHPASPAV